MKPVRLACLLLSLVGTMVFAQNPVPLINNPLVPTSVAPGGASFTLTVNGTGFVSHSVVNWNGAALATTFVSGSQLTATVPAANIVTPSTASVRVVSPAPGGGNSNVGFFDIRKPFSAVAFGQSLFALGLEPLALIASDLNADGWLDVASVNQDEFGAGSVSVLIGNGDGTFQTPIQYSAGNLPSGLVAADFNGDGHIDLEFVSFPNDQFPAAVSVMLGNGDGTFQMPQNLNLPSGPYFAGTVAGDFNGDGKLDLAVAQASPTAAVLVLRGNGDGTFQTPVTYAAGTSDGYAVTAGDFNGDGNLDLAASTNDGEVFIFLGNGDGTFQNGVSYPDGSVGANGVGNLVAADFNGDGKLDLAADPDNITFSILLGNGDGSFQAPVGYRGAKRAYYSNAATDLNGDGKLDIVSGEQVLAFVDTSLGNGDGTFRSYQLVSSQSTGSCCTVAGDFNGDGLIDLAQGYGNGVEVLLQATSVLSTTRVNFGKVTVGSSAIRKVTLSNIGTTSVTINKIKLSGKDFNDFGASNNCGSSLAPGANCTLTLRFRPGSKAHFAENLTISDSAVSDFQIVTLQGVGD